MTEQNPTGNPVFDYRAGFRTSAAKIQRALILGGLLAFIACGAAALFGDVTPRLRLCTAIASIGGLALMFGGFAWGFYWRRKLRNEFREKYKSF